MTRVKCTYAKSDMTPCVIKDGPVAYATDSHGNPICVGCERGPKRTGVPVDDALAAVKRERRP